MAGLRGNQAWLLAGKQSAKGTPATVGAATSYKNPFSGGNIVPTREIDSLSETDANRDRGVSFVQTHGVEGSPEIYVRDASIGFYLFAVLGQSTPTGTTPNYTHTAVPANTIPYITFWKNLGNVLYERYEDCFVSSLTVSAEAGQPLTAEVGVQGRKAVRLAADPDVGSLVALASEYVYNYNDATVTLAGGATALVSSFELTIENNVTSQQTDDVTIYDLVVGTREVSLSFDLIFETLDEYNKFHYGGASGTTVSPTIYTTSAEFEFANGVNNSVKFTLPSLAYEEFEIAPDAGGDPVTASVRGVAQRGASPVITTIVDNQVASY